MQTKHVFFIGPDDSEDFPRIDFSTRDNRRYDWLTVSEMIDGLKKPDIEFLSSIDIKVATRCPQFDCLSFNARLFVSDAARRMFETLVPGDCKFISLRVNGRHFHILLAHKIIDALDKAKSELEHFPEDPKRVMLIRKYWFHKMAISDPSLFRIPENAIRVFVTDALKDTVERSGLVGFRLVDFEAPPAGTYIS